MLADGGIAGSRDYPPPFHPLGPWDHEALAADGAVLTSCVRLRALGIWVDAAPIGDATACLFEMPGPLQQAGEVGIWAVGEEERGLCEVGGLHCRAEADFEEGRGVCPVIGRRVERWGGVREGVGLAFRWGGYVVW